MKSESGFSFAIASQPLHRTHIENIETEHLDNKNIKTEQIKSKRMKRKKDWCAVALFIGI